ncbi:MAG: trehalose operon repressor [Catonella sp.]|nr:trehalose operon repressor [Catonella sp.]MDY6356326.1 trehalose operon repressor [Catonella sp.]
MPKEKFESIYKELRDRIEDETYPAGQMLPSEHQLTDEFECSRNTVRRAISRLTSEGYVQPQHGKGVRIIYTRLSPAEFTVGGIESFAETAARNKLKTVTKVIVLTELTCDDRMSSHTGFDVGDELIYIQRVRLLDGVAAILDTNIFLKSVTGPISKEIAESSIYKHLENDMDITITMSRRKITAERASQADNKFLDLKDYDFVSVVTGQTFDKKGRMFEYTQSRHRPDYFAFYDTAVRKKE